MKEGNIPYQGTAKVWEIVWVNGVN